MEVPPEGLERLELCGLESDKMLTSWECAEVLEAGLAAPGAAPAFPLPQHLTFGPPWQPSPSSLPLTAGWVR